MKPMNEQPSQRVKDLLDLDLMQLAMYTLDALHSMKAGAPVPLLRTKLENLVRIANTSLNDLDIETPKEP